MVKNNKVVMVIERSNIVLDKKLSSDGKNYILEGTFTFLGVKNNNNRVYLEKEFMPHMEYLQKKIEKGRLLGELDHPKEFETSLTKASHTVEFLEYDDKTRSIKGRIRLLSTPNGMTARNLIDDGIQLSISSRAAGVVREDNTVEIKRIFSYDLVADPGFENAQLTRINESLGFDKDDETIGIYKTDISESQLDSIISEADMIPSNKKDTNQIYNENKANDMDKEFVSIVDFNKFSDLVNEKIENFKNELSEKDKLIEKLSKKTKIQEDYLTYVKEETEKFIKYNETQLLEVNNVINYVESIANEGNKLQTYTKYISSIVDKIISYNEHQTFEHNELEQYVDNYLSEQLNHSIENIKEYTMYVAENLDKSILYTESVKEDVKYLVGSHDNVVENLNRLINYDELQTEKINAGLNYANYISEEINRKNGDIDKGSYLGINENRDDTQILIDNSKTIANRMDILMESIQEQKVIDSTQKADISYFNLLSESKKREYMLLDENQKQKVAKAIREYKPMSESEVVELWNKAVNPIKTDERNKILIDNMPKELVPIWESLDDESKNRLILQSNITKINLDNPNSIANFWNTRKVLTERIDFEALQNGNLITENETFKSLGYDQSYMANVLQGLDNYNKKK